MPKDSINYAKLTEIVHFGRVESAVAAVKGVRAGSRKVEGKVNRTTTGGRGRQVGH